MALHDGPLVAGHQLLPGGEGEKEERGERDWRGRRGHREEGGRGNEGE